MFANFNFVNNNYNKNSNFINNNNNNNFNNYSNLRYNNSQANIEISYDNYFTNNYYKEIEKEKYANDLRQQIEENKLRKEMEKRKKEEEDLKDELRLIKENQQLEIQQKKENQKIISNNKNININNNIKTIKNNNNNNKNNNNNNYLNSYLQQRANEIKTKDNEIKNLLSSINDTFFHQINRMNFELEKLKEVNLHSNLYKIDLAKSIQDLSNTLHKKNYDQSFKKDSMYKMMIETNKRKLNLQNHLKFDKIPYYNNNYPYINLSRSISYNVPRTKPLKELGWYY